MTKTAKELLIWLIISVLLNIVFLLYIILPPEEGPLTSVEVTKAPRRNYGYTSTRATKGIFRPERASQIEKMIGEQKYTFKMLNAAQLDYIGKKLILYGYAELTSYYNWGYDQAMTSHYSVELKDLNYETIDVYFPKAGNEKLFELLGQASFDEQVPLRVEAIELESRYYFGSPRYVAEGLNWRVLK